VLNFVKRFVSAVMPLKCVSLSILLWLTCAQRHQLEYTGVGHS
jgi:hypothetical protein